MWVLNVHSFYLKIAYTIFMWAITLVYQIYLTLIFSVGPYKHHWINRNWDGEHQCWFVSPGVFFLCKLSEKVNYAWRDMHRKTEISNCSSRLYKTPGLNHFIFSCPHRLWGSWPLFQQQFTLWKLNMWLWSASGKHTWLHSALLTFCRLGLITEPRRLEQEINIIRIVLVLFQ